jgi:hypothetical protein
MKLELKWEPQMVDITVNLTLTRDQVINKIT